MPYAEREVTSDVHAKFLKRVQFKPASREDEENVLKTNDEGEVLEFRPWGQIERHVYLEHSLKYYYDKYLKDPAKKKADWDYHEAEKQQEKTRNSVVFGCLVVLIKVNGKEITSQIYMRDKFQFEATSVNLDNIWYRPTWKSDGNAYAKQAAGNYFPLLIYLRDQAKPGRYKVEMEVYPGTMECSKGTERSDEIIAKGEFTLVINPEEAKEISECGGVKKVPTDIRYVTLLQGTFEYK